MPTDTYYDRMIVGGVSPNKPLPLEAGKEVGIINIDHEWQSLSHVRWDCKYHVVIIP